MTQVEEDKVMVLVDGSLKLVTPEGAPVRGLRTPEIPMTEAVEAVGMCRNDNSGVRGPGWRLK